MIKIKNRCCYTVTLILCGTLFLTGLTGCKSREAQFLIEGLQEAKAEVDAESSEEKTSGQKSKKDTDEKNADTEDRQNDGGNSAEFRKKQAESDGSDAGNGTEINSTGETQPEMIYVDVCGAVANPGVFQLAAGSRVFQAIEAAGGYLPEAALTCVNRAGVLTDGQQLYILTQEEMERQGIRKLWLTPHIMEDIPNTTDALKTRFRTWCESYRGNIRLELAAEYMLDNLFVRRLEADDILPLHEEKRYLLVETSYFNPPMRLLSMLKHIREKGYHPLLAHPERYEYMQMADYKALQQAGVAFQLNIPSLAGMYGRHVQKKAEALQEADMYTLRGNDTHSLVFFQNLLNEKIRK